MHQNAFAAAAGSAPNHAEDPLSGFGGGEYGRGNGKDKEWKGNGKGGTEKEGKGEGRGGMEIRGREFASLTLRGLDAGA